MPRILPGFPYNANQLIEVLALRASGWNLSELSVVYKRDRNSIRFQLKRHNILPLTAVMIKPRGEGKRTIQKREDAWYLNEFGEKICRGKNYSEYISDHKKRDPNFRFVINPAAADPDSFASYDDCL